MSWFMSWFKPLKSTKQTWGGGRAGGGGKGPDTDIHPSPLSAMAPMLTYTHPLNPCTHGSKHSHTPIPTPSSPMAQTQTPIPNPFHPWPPILTHTHPLNPFIHGPKHSHTPIPTPSSPMAKAQTPIPNPFHSWPPILTHTHPLNPFTHRPKHSYTHSYTLFTHGLDTDTHP